jgi:hypothetical protein
MRPPSNGNLAGCPANGAIAVKIKGMRQYFEAVGFGFGDVLTADRAKVQTLGFAAAYAHQVMVVAAAGQFENIAFTAS